MKKILLLAMLTIPLTSVAQVTFTINGFSDKYYGKLYISDTSEVFSAGWVAVYNKQTNKQLLKVESDNLAYTLHEGQVKANVVEAPYGEQSVLIYDDFNFDGVKDFAIMEGNNSCYGGPSYEVYLASGNTFVHSTEFTRLAQEYCGMFQYDAKEKKISTMTKSGCCWHQFCEYVVENGVPVMAKEVVDDGFGGHWPYSNIVTTKIFSGGKKVKETVDQYVELEELKENTMLSFVLEKSGKTVVLLKNSLDYLSYLLVKSDGMVEISYPANVNAQENADAEQKAGNKNRLGSFTLSKEANGYTLSFNNGYADYFIYEYNKAEKRIGVKATFKGKTYDLVGKPSTKIKSLKDINRLTSNVELAK